MTTSKAFHQANTTPIFRYFTVSLTNDAKKLIKFSKVKGTIVVIKAIDGREAKEKALKKLGISEAKLKRFEYLKAVPI